MKIVFLFIDGVGLAPASAANPITADTCPTLYRLMHENGRAIDACLGVEGLPQSATGQTAIFTGINSSKAMGRHVEGFPGPTLRKIIEADNIFLALKRIAKRGFFADGYLVDAVEEIRNRRFRSVTTTAALTAPEVIAMRDDLLANRAVCHDITREVLRDKGYTGPLVTPEEAAEHLVQIALGYDYTLFEFFESDRAGHSCDIEQAKQVLVKLDRFLTVLVPLALEMKMLVVLTSDHGNIEAMDQRSHTRNPVPWVVLGEGGEELFKSVDNLVEITPQILRVLNRG